MTQEECFKKRLFLKKMHIRIIIDEIREIKKALKEINIKKV
jgi:hypothetical protein